jgi:hypothetical protein
MSKWIAAVLCLTGCVSQIHRLEPGWDGSTAPDCTESDGLVIGDALAAGVGLAIGADAARSSNGSGLGLLSLVAGTGLAVAAAIGAHEVRECRAAHAEWRIGNAAAARAHQDVHRREASAPAPPAPPSRGFYCTTSAVHATLGRCMRERAACEQARGLAADAIPDLSPCTLVEAATCFAGTCYPTSDACAAHQGPDSVGDCAEQR